MTADIRFTALAQEIGHDFSEIKIGGSYTPVVQDGCHLWVSGQIPRVGDEVLYLGVLGNSLNVQEGQKAAAICTMRALALLQRVAGSLDDIASILRITVYVRSAADFTQQSEVADGASDVLARVLKQNGAHARTSIGVLQLPKGASVELDVVATIKNIEPSH
mgnify:CR=1 FL=1